MKNSGSYASLLRGVSLQPAELRQPGQHAEQVNMLSDPVDGLVRRRGSRYKAKMQIREPLSGVFPPAELLATGGYREVYHSAGGKEYSILIREKVTQGTGYYDYWNANSLPSVMVYNITDGGWCANAGAYHNSGLTKNATDLAFDGIAASGVQAIVSLGRYVPYALKGVGAGLSQTTRWFNASLPQYCKLIVWVRGGAYDRSYGVTLGSGLNITYTTPAASVAGSATAISPQNIAEQLRLGFVANGYTVTRNGSHLYVDTFTTVQTSDGGDGSLLRAVSNVADSVTSLPLMGYPGQIVAIGDEGLYFEAVAKAGSGFGEVIWEECAGVVQSSTAPFGLITVNAGGAYGTFAMTLPGTAMAGAPSFLPSDAGDATSNPAPAFLRGRAITYLGVLQDRLLVGAGAALAVSAAGDYFNFFRATVATVPINGAFEMVAQGSEDDILRYDVTYNRNHIIFGDKRQYLISGTTALTPTSPNMAPMTSYEGAAQVAPVAAGGQIYYGRNQEEDVGIYQIQPGVYVDSAESFPTSAQVRGYIPAEAAQLAADPGAPAHILVRTRADDKVYVFSYIDQPDGRKQEAWFRWEFAGVVGKLLGMRPTVNGLLLYWYRKDGTNQHIVADLLPMTPTVDSLPYLDSLRPYTGIVATDLRTNSVGWAAAYSNTSVRWLLGVSSMAADASALIAQYPTETASLRVGAEFESYVTLTNPYVKDKDGRPVLTARQVLSRYTISMRDTAELVANADAYPFRTVGGGMVGRVPVGDFIQNVSVGKEVKDYTMTLKSRTWLPLSIKAISWTGQLFNRTPSA